LKLVALAFLLVVFVGPSYYRFLERRLHPQPQRHDSPNLIGYLHARPGIEFVAYLGLLVVIIVLVRSLLALFSVNVPWFFPIFP
jgi:hypothetical protein